MERCGYVQPSDLTTIVHIMKNKTKPLNVIAVLLCFTAFGVIFESDDLDKDIEKRVDRAWSRWEENNSKAEGAPQQQVVTGWQTNDLLEIQIAADAAHSKRQIITTSLVGLAVVAALIGLGTSGSRTGRDDDDEPDNSDSSPPATS
jgi:hypothetical protein